MDRWVMPRWSLWALALAVVGLLSGCGQNPPTTASLPPPPPQVEPSIEPESQPSGPPAAVNDVPAVADSGPAETDATSPVSLPTTPEAPPPPPLAPVADDPAPATPVADALVPTSEVWMAYYLGSAKVGHAVTRIYEVNGDERGPLRRTEMEQMVTLLRNGDRVTQQLKLSSLERPGGDVLEFVTSVSDGGPAVTTEGRRDGGQMHVVLKSPGSSSLQTIRWESQWRGFFADQQLLSSQPPAPGDQRTVTSFIPVLNIVGETTMVARDWEEIETPFGRERLLRVDWLMKAKELQFPSQVWCDQQGNIRKYYMPQGDMTAYRTVRELALAENEDVDLYAVINIGVTQPLPQPHQLRQATYRASLRHGGDPARLFVSDGSQIVTRLDPTQVEIVVRRIRPTEPSDMPNSAPEPQDSQPNSLIQSDDSLIQQMAAEIAPAEADTWTWLLACEKYVARTIERKALTEAFASAAEVARSKTGDCTEHAVLLAALCRARGIPARVATGLVAYQDMYAFHMWNEVWLTDRWVPLDATLGLGGIGAGHIKLGVSSLEGVSPFAALAPVLEVMGSLNLDIVSYQ